MSKLLIFTDFVSERLVYTFQFICKSRGIEFHFCNDPQRFESDLAEAKFVYSEYPFENSYPTILPANLIFEEGIKVQQIAQFHEQDFSYLQFAKVPDLLASIFFVIACYEEYLPYSPDEHDRFTAQNSILNEYQWLNQPIADIWAEKLLDFIQLGYPTFSYKKPRVSFTLTFDIDNTFAFKHKNTLQLLGGRVKDFLQGNSENQILRGKVLSGEVQDPNDTFDTILDYVKGGINTKVFWHLGDFKKFDRNIAWTNAVHQRLIQKLAAQVQVGIHPSYFSYLNESLVKQERGRLEHILKKPVFHSRQHFLKIRFPGTFQLLHNITIKHDYSLGFADAVGFRLGTAQAVPFFNLITDEVTDLMLHPFIYMDGTLNQYMKKSPEEAKEIVLNLIHQVKTHGGEFMCIWHNDTINNLGQWVDWKQVLDFTIEQFQEA